LDGLKAKFVAIQTDEDRQKKPSHLESNRKKL
jgi:hypothetical protein